MTTADMPRPILEPIVEGRPVVVEAPTPVEVPGKPRRVVQPTRAERRDRAARAGAVDQGWIADGAPPTVADLVKIRMVEREPWFWLRHRCIERTENDVFEVDGGWACVCEPMADEHRKANTNRIRAAKTIRIAWITYNHLVAIPATVLLYLLAWIVQHPGRLLAVAAFVLFVIGVMHG